MYALEVLLESFLEPLEPPDVYIPEPTCPQACADVLDAAVDEHGHPARFKVLYGGRGAGRSWSVARKLLARGMRRRLRVLCARELQKSLKDSVYQLLKDQIERLDGEYPEVGYAKHYKVLENEIRGVNGTVFWFEGLHHNVKNIKSKEGIDILWVEEAEAVSEDSWEKTLPTIRKEGSEVWVNFNPDQETDPVYKRWVHNPKPGWSRQLGSVVRKVGWQDNPFISQELLDLKDYAYKDDPERAAHVWGGECLTMAHAAVLRGKWRVEAFEPQAGWGGPYYGLDFGFSEDPFAAVELYLAPGATAGRQVLYVRREAYKVHLEIDHAPDYLKQRLPGCEKYVIMADSQRPDSISYLRRHTIKRIRGAEKGAKTVEDGIAWLLALEAIVIHPECENYVDECRMYSFKVDPHTEEIMRDIVDSYNHLIDATRYALEKLIKYVGPPVAYSPAAERARIRRKELEQRQAAERRRRGGQ